MKTKIDMSKTEEQIIRGFATHLAEKATESLSDNLVTEWMVDLSETAHTFTAKFPNKMDARAVLNEEPGLIYGVARDLFGAYVIPIVPVAFAEGTSAPTESFVAFTGRASVASSSLGARPALSSSGGRRRWGSASSPRSRRPRSRPRGASSSPTGFRLAASSTSPN